MRVKFILCFASIAAGALFLLAAAENSEPAKSSKLDGTWKWSFTMPDGGKVEPKAKLKAEGDSLSGTSSFRTGFAAPIQDGKVAGDDISWTVVREQSGRKVTTHYKGKLHGDTIKGTIQSDWNGDARSYPWEAKRMSDTPEGNWRWEIGFGNFRSENTARLKIEGQKLTGKVKSRDRETDIKDGKFKSGELSFTVVRERDGNEIVSYYRGKLDGDTIEGTVETEFGGNPRTNAWVATRTGD